LYVFIGCDKGKQFRFVFIPSPLEAGTKTSSYGGVVVCISLSTSCRKSIDWFEENISKIVHNQSFLNILSNLPLDLQCTQLKSCLRLRVGAWLFIHPVIFFIRLASDIFPP
jgi:hypothetical protein